LESNTAKVLLVAGDAIARYGFPGGHPFGTDRHEAFMSELKKTGLDQQLLHADPRPATRAEIERFHTAGYIDLVIERSLSGVGLLDGADTPAFKGVYEAAASVDSCQGARQYTTGRSVSRAANHSPSAR